jgi:Ca2+-binding EF-hand superfamily protein
MRQGGGVFEVFKFMDADESNAIDFSEFKDVVKKLGVSVTTEQVRTLFRKYDVNRNNSLSFGEFAKMV